MAGRAWPFGQLRLPSASRARRPGAYTPDLQWKIFCHAATALGLEMSPALTAQSMSFAVSRSPQWGRPSPPSGHKRIFLHNQWTNAQNDNKLGSH